jgi:nucleoside-diphosphate-sugar epimerase
MGAHGFVGSAVAARLAKDGVPVLALGRNDVDLLASNAAANLAAKLQPLDAFVAVSARAPVKNPDMLVENMIMARAMAKALAGSKVAHVINVSSDAIYADSPDPLTEASVAAPGSLHGVMHLARELIFRAEVKVPLAMVRPTLIHGAGDPHNGYGPNKFRRLAARGEDIVLFGEGEERRDHIWIDDVAELIVQVIYHRSGGELNLATGQVWSFREVAQAALDMSGKRAALKTSARSGPMPHNGYRPFDPSAVKAAFPSFRFTPFEDALRRAFEAERSSSN